MTPAHSPERQRTGAAIPFFSKDCKIVSLVLALMVFFSSQIVTVISTVPEPECLQDRRGKSNKAVSGDVFFTCISQIISL